MLSDDTETDKMSLTSETEHIKGFDLNISPGCPRAGDSEAVYSSKALWRSVLAVIIQLTGSEQSRSARPLLPPRTTGLRRQEEL